MVNARISRVLRASVAGIAQRFIQVGTTLISIPIVLHSLGVDHFGVWAAATSLDWLTGMLDLGVGAALVSLLPHCIAINDTEKPPQYVAAALFWSSCMCLLALSFMGVFPLVYGVRYLWTPFFVAGVSIALCVPLSISGNLWLALQKGYVGSAWAMAQNLIGTTALIIAALYHTSVTMMVFAPYFIGVVGTTLCLAHALVANPVLRPTWKVPRNALWAVLNRGGALFICSIAGYCAVAFDTVITLHLLGPEASARMAIIMRICYTATGLLSIAAAPLWPGFSDAIAKQDLIWLRRGLVYGTIGLTSLAVFGSIFVVLAGSSLLHFWLQNQIQIHPITYWLMAAWIIAGTLPIVAGLLLNARLHLRPQVFVLLIAASISVFVKILFGKFFGINAIIVIFPIIWLFFVVPAYFRMAYEVLRDIDKEAMISQSY